MPHGQRIITRLLADGTLPRAARQALASKTLTGARLTEVDQDLVQRSRRGDRAAFEELVRRCARLVFARIYLETGDSHRTEDLVQDTFLHAWKRIGDLEDAKQFRAWLNAIAQRVVVDAARRDSRKKRGSMRIVPAELSDIADRSERPDERVELQEQRHQALAVLRSMPEEYRLPLMLRYLAGADYDTIARQLALSNGSLRGLLQRGMKMLREQLCE
jgi:RNA polymerase sigma-70 factor (ECF subfamily)